MVRITTLTPNHWKIFKLLYDNQNKPLHLREIARQLKIDAKAAKRHLDWLKARSWLRNREVGNLIQYEIKQRTAIPLVYPILDRERFQSLKLSKQQAVQYYLEKLQQKPIIAILFGSTVTGTDNELSDIDIMLVVDKKIDDTIAKQYVGIHTSEKIQSFQVTFQMFFRDLKMQEDKVLASAINSGYPIFNEGYYYEVLDEQKRI